MTCFKKSAQCFNYNSHGWWCHMASWKYKYEIEGLPSNPKTWNWKCFQCFIYTLKALTSHCISSHINREIKMGAKKIKKIMNDRASSIIHQIFFKVKIFEIIENKRCVEKTMKVLLSVMLFELQLPICR